MPADSMMHWRDDRYIAIDTVCSGPLPYYHECIKVSAVLLNSRYQPVRDHMPLDMWLRPANIERMQTKVTADELKIMNMSMNRVDSIDIVENWLESCLHNLDKGKIRILGWQIHHWLPMFQDYLGIETYTHWFREAAIDLQTVIQYMNDLADLRNEKIPYGTMTLASVGKLPHMSHHRSPNDSLRQSLMIAAGYRRLLGDPWAVVSKSILVHSEVDEDGGLRRRLSSEDVVRVENKEY